MPQKKLIRERIASGQTPYSQQAQSLSAIGAFVTQKIAALQYGQTEGQVSFWLDKFRTEGMSTFPEELLVQADSETPLHQQMPTQLTPPEVSGRD